MSQLMPTGRVRFLLGALGALSPSLLNLLLVDANAVLTSVTLLVVGFYVLRFGALAALGGLWAWMHKRETELAQLFQLGIVAPALILGGLNAVNTRHAAFPSFIRLAFAQTMARPCAGVPDLYVFVRPVETRDEQIKRGLYGRRSDRTWFVIAGYHDTLKAARTQVGLLVRAGQFKPDLYCAPDRRQPYTPFAVVIGAQLSQADAEKMLKDALFRGVTTAALFDVATP